MIHVEVIATLPEVIAWIVFAIVFLSFSSAEFADTSSKLDHLLDTGVNGGFIIMARAHYLSAGTKLVSACFFVTAGLVAIAGFAEGVIYPMLIAIVFLVINSYMFRQQIKKAVKAEAAQYVHIDPIHTEATQ